MASDSREAEEGVGEAALRDALAEHGEAIAGALEHTDEFSEIIDLAILTIACADDEEVEEVTASIVNLIQAVDSLATDETVALAGVVSENGRALSRTLERVVRLDEQDALEPLLDLAEAVSSVNLDDDATAGLDRFAAALSAAETDAQPVGPFRFLRGLLTSEGRAGLGYLLAVLKALGRGADANGDQP